MEPITIYKYKENYKNAEQYVQLRVENRNTTDLVKVSRCTFQVHSDMEIIALVFLVIMLVLLS